MRIARLEAAIEGGALIGTHGKPKPRRSTPSAAHPTSLPQQRPEALRLRRGEDAYDAHLTAADPAAVAVDGTVRREEAALCRTRRAPDSALVHLVSNGYSSRWRVAAVRGRDGASCRGSLAGKALGADVAAVPCCGD
ncbi:hypothetical protein B0A49_04100 [Cryomyces minteri]|uniref:Uncharacterized protein n=1 Tax=Cryomyces minteri TaxID=331657 RepID=A0A4U0XFE3_9PEZI|nr:hypothetical protein B0A49_04100 [Cryomyces minteri]